MTFHVDGEHKVVSDVLASAAIITGNAAAFGQWYWAQVEQL